MSQLRKRDASIGGSESSLPQPVTTATQRKKGQMVGWPAGIMSFVVVLYLRYTFQPPLCTLPLESQTISTSQSRVYLAGYETWNVHVDMLNDHPRTDGYHDGIMAHKEAFDGLVAIDVGSGNGVQAYFAAKAGAKRVYAIEASKFANLLKQNVEANHLQDTITVVQSMAEDLTEAHMYVTPLPTPSVRCAWGNCLVIVCWF